MVLLDSVMSLYNSDKLFWLSNDFATFLTFRNLQWFIHGDENFNLGLWRILLNDKLVYWNSVPMTTSLTAHSQDSSYKDLSDYMFHSTDSFHRTLKKFLHC